MIFNDYQIITKNNNRFLTDKNNIYEICLDGKTNILKEIPIKFNKGYLANTTVYAKLTPCSYNDYKHTYGVEFNLFTKKSNEEIYCTITSMIIYGNLCINCKYYYELLINLLNKFVNNKKYS